MNIHHALSRPGAAHERHLLLRVLARVLALRGQVQSLWSLPRTRCLRAARLVPILTAVTMLAANILPTFSPPARAAFDDIVRVPYSLNTLRAMHGAPSDPFRATGYNGDNEEIGPHETSHKVLGGGLEASAYDLGRFGIKLVDGQILSAASLTDLWAAPDGQANYGLGWSVGTGFGSQVVAKDGAQSGSRTNIRMYPEEEIVIVVLTNRKTGGHSPSALAKAIGSIVLDHYTAAAANSDVAAATASGSTEASMPKEEPAPTETPQQRYFNILAWMVGADHTTLSKEEKGQVAQTMGILQKAGYTEADLRTFWHSMWKKDWRWLQKGTHPTLKQVRAEIGKIRVDKQTEALALHPNTGRDANGKLILTPEELEMQKLMREAKERGRVAREAAQNQGLRVPDLQGHEVGLSGPSTGTS